MQDSDPSVTVADAGQGREVTARLGESTPNSGDVELDLPEGARSLGRYLLLAKIGEGGMGEVHRAYDPQLRREVALKLVKTDRADATEQARLLREAQAMAKLSHPNVAAVYDAGEIDGQVFIALEYLEGPDLAGWLRQREHTVAEILEVFAGAGRGLAAAHAAGLIHRDFKPANVLVPLDQRPRVLDFGLARLAGADEALDRTAEGSASASDDGLELGMPLTQAGIVMGTPAYMAPEQHWGTEPDVRWDVYAFCVALYEALYGRRPFHGVGIRELAKAKLRGLSPMPPAESRVPQKVPQKVPQWIHSILGDGLHPDIKDRIPDMPTLLERLADDPARRRRRLRRMMTTGAVGAGLAVVIGLVGRAAENPCADGSERVEAVWNGDRATAIGDAFTSTGLPYATMAWSRVEAQIDEFGQAWATQYQDACEATHVRNEQSEHLLDLRMDCLKRSARELDALLGVFEDPDETVVERSHLAVLELPAPGRCTDVELLDSGVEPPNDPETAEQVSMVRDELARARATNRAGKYEEAAALLQTVLTRADHLGYAPLRVEVLRTQGENLGDRGQFEESEKVLLDAYFSATELRYRELTWRLALDLEKLVGYELQRHPEGRLWARHARAHLGPAREGTVDEADLLLAEGELALSETDYPNARESVERAFAIYADAFGPEDLRVAPALGVLAIIADYEARYEEAEKLHEKAIEIKEQAMGSEHPAVLRSLANLAVSYVDYGRVNEGTEKLRAVLERQRAALGPEHPIIVNTIVNLGYALYHQEHNEEALEHYREALPLREALYGPESPEVAHLINNMAAAQRKLGRHEEALSSLREALRIREASLGSEHLDVAIAYQNVAAALSTLLRYEEAHEYYERAVEIAERSVGTDHFRLANILWQTGRNHGRLGRPERGIADLRRAVEIALKNDRPAVEIAEYRFTLAEQLWAAGQREAAIDEAEKTRAVRQLAGQKTTETDAWLEERR